MSQCPFRKNMTKNNDKKIDYLKVIFLKIQKGSSEIVKYHVSNAIQKILYWKERQYEDVNGNEND